MYKAIYRKYRPDSFSKIVGQKHVVKTLKNAIEQQKIGHAYLFHGPRGTGKTSIAKIFAEAVNCLATETSEKPCHQCENCKLIDTEQATDIIELDAASNNGVDEIRQIREYARYAPTQLKYKVYIIDEVHMLSTAAFNALLKTLEEPPAHVIFVLATTEIHKIPQTIISRCQRFDFKKVTIPEMIDCINPILEQEQIKITDEALHYLAEYADGGMRDALSVLDQVSAYSDTEVQLKDIQDVIGTVGEDVYEKLVHDVLASDSRDILLILDDIIASGKNIQLFVEEFLKYLLREIEKNIQGIATFDARILFFMLEKMNKLAAEMRSAFLPQVALQALFLEITYEGEQDQTLTQTPPPIHKEQQQPNPVMEETQPDLPPTEPSENADPVGDVLDLFNEDNFIADEQETDYQPQDEYDPEPMTQPEEITTIFEEISHEKQVNEAAEQAIKQQAEKPLAPPQPQATVDEQVQRFDQINEEKRRLLLQRTMAEVVIYPEYNQLEKIKRKWQLIKFDPTNQITIMLLDMEPKIATKKEIVLSSFNKALANQLQMPQRKAVAEAFISELIGQAYEIIVVDEVLWGQERTLFSEKWRANQVSTTTIDQLQQEVLTLEEQAAQQGYEYVALDFEETKEEPEEDPIVQDAVNLFGEDLVETKEK